MRLIMMGNIGERRHLQAFPDFPTGEAYIATCGLRIVASTDRDDDGVRWRHISVSLKDRYPSWEELKAARYQFFDDEREVIQVFPPKSAYLNLHDNCFHLWSRVDRKRLGPKGGT